MEKNMDTNFDFNKTGKFDFGKVGKRMPYSTPDGFLQGYGSEYPGAGEG